MAAPNYEQVRSFSKVTKQLEEAAVDEFMGELVEGMSHDEVMELAVMVAEKYKLLGAELGAQWYDLCAELAGYETEPAELADGNPDIVRSNAQAAANTALETGDFKQSFSEFLSNEIMTSIRLTGYNNMRRDYARGTAPGRWCRVPVGDTCAFCIMMASNGAWYLSKESAGGDGNKFHKGCDCVQVYHASAESIKNYDKLDKYKAMYYQADNMRIKAAREIEPYPEELQDRVNLAKLQHEQKRLEMQERGEYYPKWGSTYENLLLMRYINDIK